MDRSEALLYMAREAPFGISVERADEYLALWGTSVSKLGVPVLNPRSVNTTTTLIVRMGYFVNVAQLASRLALSLGLYESRDHAEQTPHRSAQKTMQYIVERAVLRLAMHEPESRRADALAFLKERHGFDKLALGELRYFRG